MSPWRRGSSRYAALAVVLVALTALVAVAACQAAPPVASPTAVAPTAASTATPAPAGPTAQPTLTATSTTVSTSTAAATPATPTPAPTPSPEPSPTAVPRTPAGAPSPTTAPSPAATPTRAATPTTAPGTSVGGTPPYLDDRSGPDAVVRSYYNAITRKEYDRAYSYWESGAAGLQPYDAFKQGFADTAAVRVTLGQTLGDRGAGQIYGYVPAALAATKADGSSQAYVGCFWLHLANPQIQDQPPFDPWAISKATIRQVASVAVATSALPSACDGQGQPEPTPSVTPQPNDVSASRYLDDRSTPEEVLRSLFNAVNRKEYDRAYSYWMPGTTANPLPSYDEFKAGYAATASVTIRLGKTTTGAAAGSLYFSVPTTLVAKTTDGKTQTYVGCYVLHLSQPALQDLPPYDPMAIRSGKMKQVANDADADALMASACPASAMLSLDLLLR